MTRYDRTAHGMVRMPHMAQGTIARRRQATTGITVDPIAAGRPAVFRAVLKTADLPAAIASAVIPVVAWRRRAMVPWAICGILTMLCVVLSYRVITRRTAAAVPGTPSLSWPSSQIFDARHQTIIVVADSNYGMSRILTSQPGSLDQYLRRDFLRSPTVSKTGEADLRLREYISNSTLPSFTDVAYCLSLF